MFVFLRRDSFYEHAEMFLRIKVLWIKIRKQSWLFWKEKFSAKCSSAHKECNFNNAAKKLDKNSKAFRSIFENIYINNQFSQRTHFMRKRLLSRRLLNWQPCQKNFPRNLKSFLLENKWEENSLLRHFLPQKVPLDT